MWLVCWIPGKTAVTVSACIPLHSTQRVFLYVAAGKHVSYSSALVSTGSIFFFSFLNLFLIGG